MKKIVCLVFLLVMCPSLYAQQLYFPAASHADTLAVDNSIPSLANTVLRQYQADDKYSLLDDGFRLQAAARNYAQVNPMLDSLTLLNGSVIDGGIGFIYRIYARVLLQHPGQEALPELFRSFVRKYFTALPSSQQVGAESYFSADLQPMKNSYAKILQELQGKDSISLDKAISLCRAYVSYHAYSLVLPAGVPLMDSINNSRFIVQDSLLIPTPGNGHVAVTVVRSKQVTGPQPVVLMFNIYAGNDVSRCKIAVNNGYIGVVANTRGKRLSDDPLEPFEHDGEDAYAVIDWISKQPWCNGKVGMYGGSYLGFSQWSALKRLHPALKTAVPQVAVGPGVDYPAEHHVHMSYMLRWLHYVMNNKLTDLASFTETSHWQELYSSWYKKGVSFRTLDSLNGKPNAIFQRWLQHPDYDAYWQHMVPQDTAYNQINIPLLTTTGYFDDDQRGAMYYFSQYHHYNKNPNYYLLIGPYDHGGAQNQPSRESGGYTIDSIAYFHIGQLVFDWFDYVMKDSSKPALLQDRVNFEVMGKNEWKHVPDLEGMHNGLLRFYLGTALKDTAYPLLDKPSSIPAFLLQTVDLADRKDTASVDNDGVIFQGLADSIRQQLKNKLVFVSAPLANPLTFSGGPVGHFQLVVNKKDVDLVFDVFAQMPDGHYMSLSRNKHRASYAQNDKQRHLLKPGRMENVVLDDNFISVAYLPKGTRIVVLLGVNKQADWEINYGTGGDVSKETVRDAGEPVQLKWGKESYVDLPVWR